MSYVCTDSEVDSRGDWPGHRSRVRRALQLEGRSGSLSTHGYAPARDRDPGAKRFCHRVQAGLRLHLRVLVALEQAGHTLG